MEPTSRIDAILILGLLLGGASAASAQDRRDEGAAIPAGARTVLELFTLLG